jgi:hypothetical protein
MINNSLNRSHCAGEFCLREVERSKPRWAQVAGICGVHYKGDPDNHDHSNAKLIIAEVKKLAESGKWPRVPCGFDITPQIIAIPEDGEQHSFKCNACSVEISLTRYPQPESAQPEKKPQVIVTGKRK